MSSQVTTRPPAGLEPIMGTNIPCFTIYADPSIKDDVDMHIVYIAKVIAEKREITLKPLCAHNPESLSKAKQIASHALIVGLTVKEDGIHLNLNESKAGAMKPETKLFLECQGKTVELGTLQGASTLPPVFYKDFYLDRAYMTYLKTMEKAVKKVTEASKKQVNNDQNK